MLTLFSMVQYVKIKKHRLLWIWLGTDNSFFSQFLPSPSSLPHFFSRQCLSLWSKLAWNFQQSSCPSFSSAGITDTHRPPSPLFCRRWTHRSCTWSQLVLSSGGHFPTSLLPWKPHEYSHPIQPAIFWSGAECSMWGQGPFTDQDLLPHLLCQSLWPSLNYLTG